MAHTLSIVHGSTTISLTTGDNYLIDYVPQPPRDNDGYVTEVVTVAITGANVTTIGTTINSLWNAFHLAEYRHDNARGNRVYIQFQPSGYASAYRTEIIRPAMGKDAGRLNCPEGILGGEWAAKRGEFMLTWTHRPYWEANSETELSLSNGSASGTGGIVIENPHAVAKAWDDSTASFDNASSKITDSGAGFGVFAVGDVISVRDSTLNDGVYTIVDVDDSSAWIQVNETLADEAAGAAIDIYDITNYVHIDSASITGSLPAPVRLTLEQGDSDIVVETIWIGQMFGGTPESFPHLLEFEDSDDSTAITGNAGASSTEYKTYSVTDTETKIAWWTLPASMVSAANSGYFKALSRFFNGTDITNIKLRFKMTYSGITWTYDQVEFDDTYVNSYLWREVDTLQIPPFRLDGATPLPLVLELWAISTTGSTETPALDAIMLFPVDGYRKLKSNAGIAFESVLVDDSVAGDCYQLVGGAKVNDITTEGEPLMLWPGKDNRLYFDGHDTAANESYTMSFMTVRAYYRPRRPTL